MLGNVWEWCADDKRPYDDVPQIDPTGPDVGSRCIRGGGWDIDARHVRCAFRVENLPEYKGVHLGLRLVRVQDGS
jgi:formylglycine-generating enzyme required for sulfatase activity